MEIEKRFYIITRTSGAIAPLFQFLASRKSFLVSPTYCQMLVPLIAKSQSRSKLMLVPLFAIVSPTLCHCQSHPLLLLVPLFANVSPTSSYCQSHSFLLLVPLFANVSPTLSYCQSHCLPMLVPQFQSQSLGLNDRKDRQTDRQTDTHAALYIRKIIFTFKK